MSASAALIDTLKRELKAQGVTYAAVARALGMSEASVKRMFSRKDFTLKRLDQVLDFAGLELAELTRSLERRDRLLSRLTPQAEKAIVADKRLVLVALRVLHQWPVDRIIRTYSMSEAECIRHLVRLDRIGIIRLLPGHRYRLMLFVTGRLSKSSREAMLVRLRRVANEFADLHNDDTRRPFEECTAMHMLVAIRPWELSKFAEMQRRK